MSTTASTLRESEIRPDHLRAGQAEALGRDVKRLRAARDAFVASPCPACGRDRPRPRFQKHGFDWTGCESCGTVYMNPRPTETILADYYAKSELYAYWVQHVFPASDAARRDKIHGPRLDRIVAVCTGWVSPEARSWRSARATERSARWRRSAARSSA